MKDDIINNKTKEIRYNSNKLMIFDGLEPEDTN